MDRTREALRAPQRLCRWVRLRSRRGRTLAILLVLGMGLLSLQAVWGQGNPAAVIQQMQAQLASLTQTVQRLNTQLTNERQLRTKQQQQMAATTRHLQQLHAAVGAAARAGDPTGTAIRSSSVDTELEKLTAAFQTSARAARARGNVASAEEVGPPDLSGARLSGAVLTGAKLAGANMQGIDLRNTDLTNAALPRANLRSAKLQGATLTGADLANAELTSALYDVHTRWPEGFDPQKHGALLVR